MTLKRITGGKSGLLKGMIYSEVLNRRHMHGTNHEVDRKASDSSLKKSEKGSVFLV